MDWNNYDELDYRICERRAIPEWAHAEQMEMSIPETELWNYSSKVNTRLTKGMMLFRRRNKLR